MSLDDDMTDEQVRFAREVTRLMRLPDHLVGLRSPWWRRVWHRLTRRP